MTKNKRKRIAVIGLGQFGSQLALDLAAEAEVLAIDSDQQYVDAIADDVHRALCLNASDLDSLKSVIDDQFDEVIVSMTESMEASILCTLHLRQIGVETIRAKAMSADHATILLSIGATQVVFPEKESASRLARQIVNPNLLDFIPIGANYRVLELNAPESFKAKTLAELRLRASYDVFVVAVRHVDENEFLFLPGADYTIRPKDALLLIGKDDDLLKLGNGQKQRA